MTCDVYICDMQRCTQLLIRYPLKKYYGWYLMFCVILIHLLSALGLKQFVFSIYSNILYPLLRNGYDNTIGALSFPSLYLALFVLLYLLFRLFLLYKKERITFSPIMALHNTWTRLLNFTAFSFAMFYILWGFNYYRPDIAELYNWQNQTISVEWLAKELHEVENNAIQQRNLSGISESASIPKWKADQLCDEIRSAQQQVLQYFGNSAPGSVQVRLLKPKGCLMIFSTAGIYIPFVMEGHIDAGLHPIQWPFTMAHEMAHGYGYTDEGVCNFIGLLTCLYSNHPYIRYSGLISYWKYLHFYTQNMEPLLAEELYAHLNTSMKQDIEEMRQYSEKYPDILPQVRDAIYDSYLKLHGVDDGMDSYNDIVEYMMMFKNANDITTTKDIEALLRKK
ncbi:MAG: putative membrane protein [Bacteroidetes bacterium OLB9]|nr:MAG: putative membrane protein [Bacteroidetes bacterium OLB9]